MVLDDGRTHSPVGWLEAIRAVIKGEQATDTLALERRFARVEAMIDGLQRSSDDGFRGVHKRLDDLNGAVTEHQDWIAGHRVEHALDAGERAGGTAYTIRLLAIVTVSVGVGGLVVNVLTKLMER